MIPHSSLLVAMIGQHDDFETVGEFKVRNLRAGFGAGARRHGGERKRKHKCASRAPYGKDAVKQNLVSAGSSKDVPQARLPA